MRGWTLIALTTWLSAAEPAWDWLPRAADDDRTCELHLTADATWSAVPDAQLTVTRTTDQLVLAAEPRHLQRITINGPSQRHLGVQLLSPGKAAGATCDGDGRLHLNDDLVILAVPRREAVADRRWGALRWLDNEKPEPCHLLAEPTATTPGVPALTQMIAAAQQFDPRGKPILVRLSGDDRFASWKHREYRQALAWLVGDLAARGATRVVLVEPACPSIDEPMLAPLRDMARDVGTAYRCTVIGTTALGDHRFWETQPGILGRNLNQGGTAMRDQLLAAWVAPGH